MSTLLEMEPRLAGTEAMEPSVDFERRWEDPTDSSRCLASLFNKTTLC